MSDYSVKAVLSANVSGFTGAFKQAENAVDKFKEATGKVAGTVGKLKGATSKVASAVGNTVKEAASKVATTVDDTAKEVNEHVQSIGHSMQAAGAATSALGVKGLKSFGDFQASLNKAAVVAGGTSKDIGGLADVANKMGRDLPLSAKDCSDAMVGMAQNGASLKELKSTFPAIAKASTAAGEDVGKTANAVQQSMNIWGGSSARNAAILVQTANASNAAVGTMGDAFANVGTTAKSLGLSLSTTSESIGLLTNKGMSTQRASMDLNHALVQMIKPSNKASKVMKELGISYVDAHGKMKPFRQILGELSTALQGYTPAEQKAYEATLYGTAGMSAIAPLIDSVRDKTGNATTSWDAYAKQQEKATGTVKQANETLNKQANEMQKNVGSALEQVGGSWDDLNNQAMQDNDKMLQSTLHMVSRLLTHLKYGKDGISRFARSFLGLSPILGPVVTVVGTFLANLSRIAAVINPFTIVAGLLGALSLKVVAAYQASKPFREEVQHIAKTFESVFGPALKHATGYLGDLFDMIAGKKNARFGEFKEFGGNIANSLKRINWKGIAENIKKALGLAISIVKSSIDRILAILRGINFGAILRAAKPVLGELQQAFETVFKAIFGGNFSWYRVGKEITAVITGILKSIKPVLSVITTLVVQIVKTAKTLFKSIDFSAILKAAKPVIKELQNDFNQIFKAIFGGSKGKFSFGSVGKGITRAITGILKVAKPVLSILTSLIVAAIKVVKQLASAFNFSKARGQISGLVGKVKGMIKQIKIVIDQVVSWIVQIIKGFIKTFNFGEATKSLSAVIKAIKDIAGLIGHFFLFGQFGKMLGSVLTILFQIIRLAAELVSWLVPIIKKLIDLSQLIPIGSKAAKLLNEALSYTSKALGHLADVFKVIYPYLDKVVNKILTLVGRLGVIIKDIVIFDIKVIIAIIKPALSLLVNIIKGALTFIVDIVKADFAVLDASVHDVIVLVKDEIRFIKSIPGNIKKGWNSVLSFFGKIGKGIKNTFTGLVKWFANLPKNMLNIGKNIIQGLINGIVSKAQDLWNKVKDIAKHIPKWMQGFLQINSPSRVMRDQVGRYIGLGLVEGIDSTKDDVLESARKLANSAIPSLDTTSFTGKLNGLKNQARSSLTGHFSQRISMADQPAYISLNLGGYNYRTFVRNITNQQNADLDLQDRRF